MGLSHETTPHTQTIEQFQAVIAEQHARNLALRLLKYEHNPDPREAPNPNEGIRIRRKVTVSRFALRPEVTPDVADHNSNVSGVGNSEIFKHLWEGKR